MVVSAQHTKLMDLVTPEQKKDVEKFLKKLKSVSEKELGDMEKEGVFTGSYAINPANGVKVPIYAGNFVVADYGSGMVMAVPAHDQRDFEFAKKYKIDVKQVIVPNGETDKDRAYTGEGKLIDSGKFNGVENKDAKKEITEWLTKEKKGKKVVQFKLRDWGISRQRYWGTPIPIIHCEKCGAVPVPEKDLPIVLPKDVKFGKGNPLETNDKWLNVKCPKCGGKGRREAETMDTFVNSSWYFLRYCDPNNNNEIFDKKKANHWCPIDFYIGGAEHACMHLIYFRFYTKFLRDIGLLKFDEPAIKLFNQGMLHGEGGEKMSKSKGNVVLPETVSDVYGIDTARLFLVSAASPDKDIDWSEKGIQGSLRFIRKLFNYIENVKFGKSSSKVLSKLNKSIKQITEDIENLRYNLAVIKIRQLFDVFESEEVSKEDFGKFLKLFSPFCPHIAEEFWNKIGNKNFLSIAEWPKVDEKKIDDKLEQAEAAAEKTVGDILNIIRIMTEKGIEIENVYLYAIPPEVKNFDSAILSEKIGKEVKIFASNDKEKYDPEGKAGKAKPGRPAIFVE